MSDAIIVPFKKTADPVLARLEEDKRFWYGELRRASAEYMKACWKLAIYKQEENKCQSEK